MSPSTWPIPASKISFMRGWGHHSPDTAQNIVHYPGHFWRFLSWSNIKFMEGVYLGRQIRWRTFCSAQKKEWTNYENSAYLTCCRVSICLIFPNKEWLSFPRKIVFQWWCPLTLGTVFTTPVNIKKVLMRGKIHWRGKMLSKTKRTWHHCLVKKVASFWLSQPLELHRGVING